MRTPELRQTQAGIFVTDFSVATTERWKTKEGEEKTNTYWHKVVCWSRTAETVAKIVEKGDLVHVTGKITYRQYEKDGVVKNVAEIEAERVILCDKKAAVDLDVPSAE
jgi:single-strand DNA-binding protein